MISSKITHTRYIESFGESYEERWGLVELGENNYSLKFSNKNNEVSAGYREFSEFPKYHEIELEYTVDFLPENDEDILQHFSDIFEEKDLVNELK